MDTVNLKTKQWGWKIKVGQYKTYHCEAERRSSIYTDKKRSPGYIILVFM